MMEETTMFDFSAFYDRIAERMPSGCRLAEVGVADGHSVIYLAKRLIERSKTFKIYAIDNMDYGGFIQMKTIYENIIKSGVAEYIEVVPKSSLEAAKDFNDGFLNFVFIDASHVYEETKKDIKAWYNKVIDGGVLAGHDFYAPEVNQAVKETLPKMIQRVDIPERNFAPEPFLNIEETTRGYGVFWVQKDFYKKI